MACKNCSCGETSPDRIVMAEKDPKFCDERGWSSEGKENIWSSEQTKIFERLSNEVDAINQFLREKFKEDLEYDITCLNWSINKALEKQRLFTRQNWIRELKANGYTVLAPEEQKKSKKK